MNKLQKFLISRSVIVAIIMAIGSGVLFYIDASLKEAAIEKRASKREAAHNRIINQFESSINNFATLVSGIRSYIQLAPKMPDAKELQKFINTQLVDINYNKELVVSFIDTAQVFKYVFTRNKIDPANLTGKSVYDLRAEKEMSKLYRLLQSDGIFMYNPMNIREGWLGVPLDFRVVKKGQVIGYMAPILNLKIVLDEVYENVDSKEFSLRFSTGDSIEFDRQAFYDGSDIFNDSIDSEFYKNFNIDNRDYLFRNLELYGQKFRIGISFKNPPKNDPFVSNLFLGWYTMLVIFLIVLVRQSFNFKQLNEQYQKANDLLTDQKKQISEQKDQANRDLNFIQNVTTLSPIHIYIYDLDADKNIFENKNISQYLGFDVDDQDMDKLTLSTHLHPSDKSIFKKRLKVYAKLKDKEVFDSTVRMLDFNKEWRWFLGKEVVFKRKDDGSPLQILGVSEDITKIKHIEIELAESEKKFNAAQEVSKVGHWEVDLETNKSFASEEFFKIFGIESKEEREKLRNDGNYFKKYIHKEDKDLVYEKYKIGSKTGGKHGLDYRIIDANKNLKFIHSIVNINLDENNVPIKTWGTIQDITARKFAEQLLEQQYTELERVNTELDRFIYGVTHDLKAPLANMKGLIALTADEKDTAQIREYYPIMETSVQKMEHFIDDLISYARNANSEIRKENVDLKLLLSEIVEGHKFTENADKIKFKISIEGGHEISTDHSRIKIVFNNLISNAIKYHDLSKTQPTIEIRSTSNQKITSIKVIDNGLGIENSEADKIFDMFYRAESNTSKASGSGIGLFILRETLKKLGGNIDVESTMGQGTTFTVNLPN